ncbi:MAG: hypothetical protein BWZ10_00510 [candidate division BRC1 bacterium ADurb.BinA364]|nr:MAG: hypothetical protein BWZ10_00510 [candidate division BRC1 bacterium ADurb.BinA364]
MLDVARFHSDVGFDLVGRIDGQLAIGESQAACALGVIIRIASFFLLGDVGADPNANPVGPRHIDPFAEYILAREAQFGLADPGQHGAGLDEAMVNLFAVIDAAGFFVHGEIGTEEVLDPFDFPVFRRNGGLAFDQHDGAAMAHRDGRQNLRRFLARRRGFGGMGVFGARRGRFARGAIGGVGRFPSLARIREGVDFRLVAFFLLGVFGVQRAGQPRRFLFGGRKRGLFLFPRLGLRHRFAYALDQFSARRGGRYFQLLDPRLDLIEQFVERLILDRDRHIENNLQAIDRHAQACVGELNVLRHAFILPASRSGFVSRLRAPGHESPKHCFLHIYVNSIHAFNDFFRASGSHMR